MLLGNFIKPSGLLQSAQASVISYFVADVIVNVSRETFTWYIH